MMLLGDLLEGLLTQRWCSPNKLEGSDNESVAVQAEDPIAFFCLSEENSSFAISILVPCIFFAVAFRLTYVLVQYSFSKWGPYLMASFSFFPRVKESSGPLKALPAGMQIPRHIAVIMDGNRRYGKKHFGDASQGHSEGAKRLSEFVEWCMDTGVETLTVYAFSTENWKRSKEEVDFLMSLFKKNMEQIRKESIERNVKLRVLASDPNLLPDDVVQVVKRMEDDTKDNTRFTLNMCVSYGGRSEIVGACRSIAADVASGKVSQEAITEDLFSDRLLSGGQVDPDLLIRTSGEQRLSNFLLWQLAYTEMIFLSKPWPAITREDLNGCIVTFNQRGRRFGK